MKQVHSLGYSKPDKQMKQVHSLCFLSSKPSGSVVFAFAFRATRPSSYGPAATHGSGRWLGTTSDRGWVFTQRGKPPRNNMGSWTHQLVDFDWGMSRRKKEKKKRNHYLSLGIKPLLEARPPNRTAFIRDQHHWTFRPNLKWV